MSAVSVTPHALPASDVRRIPVGKVGVWWFLASEIMVFGGLIASYLLYRIAHGGWAAEAAHVSTRIGAINTVVLVTSSLTMVKACRGVEDRKLRRAGVFLLCTVLLGLTFLGIKAYEYSLEIGYAFTPARGLFWSFYYTMTGLHGLHVLAGIIANAALLVAAMRGHLRAGVERRVEFAGLYWHFVDVVWIFLFPLLYLS